MSWLNLGAKSGAKNNERSQIAEPAIISAAAHGPALAPVGEAQAIAEFTLEGDFVAVNEAFCDLFGYEPDEFRGKHHAMLASAREGEDDRQLWGKVMRGESQTGQFRMTGKGGREFWLQACYVPSADVSGKISRVVMAGMDITEFARKAKDDAAELRVRSDIMNETSIVSYADLKGDIVAINEKFIEVSKYSRDELIGKPHNTTRHPDMPKEVFKEMWGTIGRGKMFRGIIKNRAKDGTPYYVDAVVAPFLGENGKPKKYLGVRYDITEMEIERQNMRGVLGAIDASYAFIEFDLNGNILNANENFLKTLGYSLADIQGRPHRMFVEQAYGNSAEYTQFWHDLRAGKAMADVFKRITRSGAEIWIQAVYAPVKDEIGRVNKIVKIATDVTQQVQASRLLQAAVEETQVVVTAAKENDLTRRIPLEGKSGAIQQLCAGVNGLLDTMSSIIANMTETASTISNAVAEITSGTDDLSRRTEKQASNLEETSASMEEIASTIRLNSENAQQANSLAIQARSVASEGGEIVTRAVDAMSRIEESSTKVSDIIGVIDEIAFQTNLLALNAAVEAARAGDAGRGFAVVASEVRSLAQRSSEAAKDIKALIVQSGSQVKDGVKLVNDAGTSLADIVTSVKKVTDIVSEIAAASKEQAVGVEEINKAVGQMDEMTQQNSALVEESAAAC
ncbi:MAG TPA: methyl-accepting chemotaxis protein, partial [Rhabdaerophilum sp.]|nr:methyl-accepting chemotaxis protein [Rhabdaerophilum sp.]